MKILIAADTYAPDVNGASYFAQRLAAGLATDHEVHVIAPSRTTRSTSCVTHGGITEHRLRSLPVLVSPDFRFCPPAGLQRRVQVVLRAVRPDVVHVQSHFPLGRAVLQAARALDIPAVSTNHFMPENLLPYVPGGAAVRRRVHGWAWRDAARVLGLADIVTSPTPYAATLAESAGVPGPVLPISCGMDLDRFSPGRDGARFRRKYGLPAGPILASVGRLDQEKNVHELIEALAVVRTQWDIHLLIVGDGAERPWLEALAAERGVTDSVTFTGRLDDAELPGAYAAADFFGIAGTAELQSLVTLEAMATGLPVLGVDAGALPHLVHHGRTGWLYRHGDVEELSRRLTALLEDPASAQQMGRRAREVAAKHDLGSTLTAFVGLYRASVRCRQAEQPPHRNLAAA